MNLRINLFPLSLLLLLMSCGGEQTTARLEVSSAFIGDASSFSGGLMVVGESATGKKFSMALNSATEGKILLEADKWSFTAIGWSGAIPFEGTPSCGILKDFSLSSENSVVKIDINSANCSAADFSAATKFTSQFNVFGCDIFYKYDENNDAYSTVTSANLDWLFCKAPSMPVEYVSKFTHYRILALNTLGVSPKGIGFESACKELNSGSMNIKLPAMKFPFIVNLYKSEADCTIKGRTQSYTFMNGFKSGSPAFDSILSDGQVSLLLATSRTKRGSSPFMEKEMPRILCGNYGSYADCFQEPVLNGSNSVNIPFISNNFDRQTILKNVDRSIKTCSVPDSNYFGVEECAVEDGNVRVKAFRNALTCQGNMYSGSSNVFDMYRKGDFIYVLRGKGNPISYMLAIYNSKGKLLHDFDLGTSIPASQIAASLNGSRIVVKSNSVVSFYTLSGSSLALVQTLSLPGADVEMSSDGSHYLVETSGVINSYAWNTITALNSLSTSGAISDMRTSGSDLLYVLKDGSLYLLSYSEGIITPNTLPSPSPLISGASKFEVADDKFYFIDSANKKYYYQDAQGSLQGPKILSLSNSTPYFTMLNGKIAVFEEMSYYMHVYNIGETTDISDHTGYCLEPLNISLGSTSKTVKFESSQDNTIPVFNELFRFVGKRTFTDLEKPFYFFQALSESDDRTGGGELRKVQEMLSPEGLGAFLSEYSSCAKVRDAAPFVKKLYFKDELTEESMAFNLRVTKSNELISQFNCASAIDVDCEGSKYDLNIDFDRIDGVGAEKIKIKLKCETKIGSFERYEIEKDSIPVQTRRELLIYSTQNDATSRYEKYSFDKENILPRRGEVTRLHKSVANGVFVRSVQTELKDTMLYSSVTELDVDEENGKIKSSSYQISDKVATFFTNPSATSFPDLGGQTFVQVRDQDTFFATVDLKAQFCMGSTEVSPYNTTDTDCGLRYPIIGPNVLSKGGINLKPSHMNISNPSHQLRADGVVFEIIP